MKKLQIKNLLLAALQGNKNDLQEFNTLLAAAEKNKWQINKRILNHLPEGCQYNVQYSMYHIVFPSGNSHLIGWVGTTQELSEASLRHSDSCHCNGSESRIAQLTTTLQPENFNNFCTLFINLQKAIKAVVTSMDTIADKKADGYYNPCYYPLLKMAGISQKAWFELDDIRNGKNS